MTNLFQIDHDLTATLHDLSDEELSSFAELYGNVVDESQNQIFIFACLQLYERTGSSEWAERAYTQAEGWRAGAVDEAEGIRATRIMALIHRKAKAKQHRVTDQGTDRDASDLFNGTRYKQTNALHDLNRSSPRNTNLAERLHSKFQRANQTMVITKNISGSSYIITMTDSLILCVSR